MESIAPGYLLLGAVRGMQQTSLNTAAWALMEQSGLVSVAPSAERGPPYIITLTADGQRLLGSAK
jgi:hypothetical protein